MAECNVCACAHTYTRGSPCVRLCPTDAAASAAALLRRNRPRETAVRTEPWCNALLLIARIRRRGFVVAEPSTTNASRCVHGLNVGGITRAN